MLIDLFKDSLLLSRSSKDLGGLKSRGCDVLVDLSYYNNEVAATSDGNFHIQSVRKAIGRSRNYIEFSGKLSDSHNEIEKLGVCKYGRQYTTIISLEDSLDYVLHRLSGASIRKIREIENYHELSRAILKGNLDVLEGFTLNTLLDVDPKLDEYLTKLVNDDGDMDLQMDYMIKFIQEVIREVGLVVEYVTFQYLSEIEKGVAVIRSKSYCSFVLSSHKKLEEVITLKSDGYDDYNIIVRSFERFEYPKQINLRYAE